LTTTFFSLCGDVNIFFLEKNNKDIHCVYLLIDCVYLLVDCVVTSVTPMRMHGLMYMLSNNVI